MKYKLKKIKSDASFREFFRLEKGNKTSIIITARKERFKNLIAYSAINKFLRDKGIHAPKTISQHFSDGIMEIEDFGNNTLLHFVRQSKNIFPLYKKSIDVIVKLQKIKPINKIKIQSYRNLKLNTYNLRNLHKESDLFLNWYLPGTIGKTKSKKFKTKIKTELNKLYKKIYFENKFIVHRDFHVSNIMPVKNKLGIIDTQDAILGNPMYDVASLIDDVRIQIPLSVKNKIFQYYFKKSYLKKNMHFLKNDFDILSIQRNLKILGIFTRLHVRDKKSSYLKFFPYTWKLIEMRLKNPIFLNLKTLIDELVSKTKRKRKIF